MQKLSRKASTVKVRAPKKGLEPLKLLTPVMQKSFTDFDDAAQAKGLHDDQGYGGSREQAQAEYISSKEKLLAMILKMQRTLATVRKQNRALNKTHIVAYKPPVP